MVEVLGAAVPEFSAMLPRGRLVELFKSQSPPLTLICAAAGYGKTVLAAQLARCPDFDVTIWVQLPDIDVSGDFVLRQVADTLNERLERGDVRIAEAVRSLESVALDDSIRIRDGLQRYEGKRVLLIIDGINGMSVLSTLTVLARDIGRYTSAESRVVTTCRRVEHEDLVDPGALWLIEERDLAFTRGEVLELVTDAGSADPEDEACQLFEDYAGHPALTCIMLRHGTPTPHVRPFDLIWQVQRTVSRFDEAAIATLYLAAMLAEGDLTVLQRCASACDLKCDWIALSRSMPLFCVSDVAAVCRSFKVHAVLCDVLDELARVAVSDDDRDTIRAIAFEQLSRDHDYVRLASALELHGTEGETAEWCERDGVSMIRHAGHFVAGRLLSQLSPLTIASSARLLLLHAHVQRASGVPSAALESALSAKRVAEVGEDDASLTAAILLVARVQFDWGLIAESRGMLEEVEARHLFDDDLPVRCLVQAYLAVSDGQAGRLSEATRRISILRRLAGGLDQGSDEAVFVANCMASVACDCSGDWKAVAAILGPLAKRSDVALLQQAHVRSNYAAAAAEIGNIQEAASGAEAVVAACTELGIGTISPYAAATLSNVSYVAGDVERGCAMNALVVDAMQRSSDHFGLAAHGINSARALRALGDHEESFSCASSAEAFLAGHGASVHMLHLMAMIEVAASHLALGETALAMAMLDCVLVDPVIDEACGHRLRCDLILAEIDRMNGTPQEAIERLACHAQYIGSGSANMTLACYIRAFPGLLGLLEDALGTSGLPPRVVKLIPDDTVQLALAFARESFEPQFADAMAHRHGAALPESSTESTDIPFVRARVFGKLEIESSYGKVEYRHWRKRKSRLLFLMLLCSPGHEIARDVILERLWPDMDRDQAQHNLYVTWSHLRKALACGSRLEKVNQFADSSSDAYWLTSALDSDLDRFNTELKVLNAARIGGDGAAVITSAMRLSEIYRGALLPIEIYEEWFHEDRTRTESDFCDAMVTGARCAFDARHYDIALVFLKRASAIDPLREDIPQLTMHCQMVAGQRSSAIETYNMCRRRLVEDLGIDPCAETVRIFQAVLAMEDGGTFESPQAS